MNYRGKHHHNVIIKSNIFVVVVKNRDFCLWLLEIVIHIIPSITVSTSSKKQNKQKLNKKWRRNIGETMSEKKEKVEKEDCRKRWKGAEKNRREQRKKEKSQQSYWTLNQAFVVFIERFITVNIHLILLNSHRLYS